MLPTSRQQYSYVNSSKQRTPSGTLPVILVILVSRTMAPPAYFANLFCGVASVLEVLPPWSFCLPSPRPLPDLRKGRPTKNTLINWEIYGNLWTSHLSHVHPTFQHRPPHLFRAPPSYSAPTPPWHPRSHA